MLPLHAIGVIRNWCTVAHQCSRALAGAARDARRAAPDRASRRHRVRGPVAVGISDLHLSPGQADGFARALCWVSTVHMPTGEGALRLQWTAREPVSRAGPARSSRLIVMTTQRRLTAAWFICARWAG